jgi:hypothetical protein
MLMSLLELDSDLLFVCVTCDIYEYIDSSLTSHVKVLVAVCATGLWHSVHRQGQEQP